MVKKLLAAEGFYELKDEDVIALRGFEAFFAHDLLAYADDEETYLGGTGSLHQWGLAASICSKKTTVVRKVKSMISWMGSVMDHPKTSS